MGSATKMMLLVSLGATVACGGKAPPIEEPLRPPEQKVETKKPEAKRTDCARVTIADQKPAIKYKQRSLDEAENLANEGFDMLRAAEKRNVPRSELEALITRSVERFIVALLADPYNVHATYNLAAAYARIGRAQCALNLLARLEELRRLASQKEKVEAKIDRLLGRKKYEGRLDPDFNSLRDDRRFRTLVKRLNPATR
jgi:hypothetical protein